jgi:hypothetical protein
VNSVRKIRVFREAISKTTKMLTSKRIKVTQQGTQPFAERHRVTNEYIRINLPVIPDAATDQYLEAIQGFVDHEVGHVLFSDTDVMLERKKIKDLETISGSLEDVFVEQELKKTFKGSAANLLKSSRQGVQWTKEHMEKTIAEKGEDNMSEQDWWNVFGVTYLRSMADHGPEIEFMKDHVDKIPSVVDRLVDMKARFLNVQSSADALDISREVKKRIYTDWEPPKKEEPEENSKEDDSGDSSEENDNQDQDDTENKDETEKDGNDEGEGDGESEDQDDSDDSSDDSGESDDDPSDEGDDPSDEGDQGESSEGDDPSDEGDQGESSEDDDADDELEEGEEGEDDDADDADDELEEGDEGESDKGKSKDSPDDSKDENDDEAGESESEDGSESEEDDESEGDASTFNPFDESEEMFDPEDQRLSTIKELARGAVRSSDYIPYTTDHDEMIEVRPGSKDSLIKIEKSVESIIGNLSRKFEKIFHANNRTRNQPGHRSGKINASALARLVVNDNRVFRRKSVMKTKNYAVSLLVDCSGSMEQDIKGRNVSRKHVDYQPKIKLAIESTFALASVLQKLKIPFEISGFTNNCHIEPTFSESNYELRRQGFTRFTPLTTYMYKQWHQNFDTRRKLALADYEGTRMHCNLDGESVRAAADRLMRRPEEGKALIVLSDGYPSGGPSDVYEHEHMKLVAEQLEKEKSMDLIGIGIASDAVSNFYSNYVVVEDVNKLPEVLFKKLSSLILQQG